jgi:DUF2889 family protein
MVTGLAPPPADPVPVQPMRRPGSVRRTSTVLMSWPGGLGTELLLQGRARDLLTPVDGAPEVLASSDLTAVTGRERDIRRIESDPLAAGLERLVGCRAGGNLRTAIAAELPEEVASGTPLYLLLDDMAGATLISGFAMFRWADVIPEIGERIKAGASGRVMLGICSGFREGSSALRPDGTLSQVSQNTVRTAPLEDPADPLGWHALHPNPDIAMRRARRIDVWLDGEVIGIDAMFRDSVWNPEGEEEVLHEYQILGSADRAEGTLLDVVALPRVLPYSECPIAAPNAAWLTGTNIRDLRGEVVQRLRSTDCCTHLNDGLRSLAEVPVLASGLLQ